MPKQKNELPDTLQRSDDHAQEIFIEAHESALETYDGDEERAHRVAWAAVKQDYKKQGDRWVQKQARGSSRSRSANGSSGETRDELYSEARRLSIPGRSKMNKDELVEAIREHR